MLGPRSHLLLLHLFLPGGPRRRSCNCCSRIRCLRRHLLLLVGRARRGRDETRGEERHLRRREVRMLERLEHREGRMLVMSPAKTMSVPLTAVGAALIRRVAASTDHATAHPGTPLIAAITRSAASSNRLGHGHAHLIARLDRHGRRSAGATFRARATGPRVDEEDQEEDLDDAVDQRQLEEVEGTHRAAEEEVDALHKQNKKKITEGEYSNGSRSLCHLHRLLYLPLASLWTDPHKHTDRDRVQARAHRGHDV